MWRGWHNDFIMLDTCSGCSCMWADLPEDGQRRSLRVSKVSVCWWSWVLWNGHWTPTPKRVVTHWLRTITQKERAEMWFTGIQTLVPCPTTRQNKSPKRPTHTSSSVWTPAAPPLALGTTHAPDCPLGLGALALAPAAAFPSTWAHSAQGWRPAASKARLSAVLSSPDASSAPPQPSLLSKGSPEFLPLKVGGNPGDSVAGRSWNIIKKSSYVRRINKRQFLYLEISGKTSSLVTRWHRFNSPLPPFSPHPPSRRLRPCRTEHTAHTLGTTGVCSGEVGPLFL